MSIENLKKILESERAWEAFKDSHEPIGQAGFYYKDNAEYFKYGHEAATNRVLPLLQKAVEMADNIAKTRYGAQGYYEENDMIGLADYYERECSNHQQKAREFLLSFSKTTESVSYFTKITEIKKESV